jgi:hypothetical protein
MKELMYVRPSYETRGDGDASQFVDAHRGVRMAVAVAEVLELPFTLVSQVRDAIERVENSGDDEPRITSMEGAAVAELLERVAHDLDSALDQDNRPRGDGGELIRRESQMPIDDDLDRVFALSEDGRVTTVYPRMSIDALQEMLLMLAQFMRQAAERHMDVAVVE